MATRGEGKFLLGGMSAISIGVVAPNLKVQHDRVDHERNGAKRKYVGWLKCKAEDVGHAFSPSGARYSAKPSATSPPPTEPHVTVLCWIRDWIVTVPSNP